MGAGWKQRSTPKDARGRQSLKPGPGKRAPAQSTPTAAPKAATSKRGR